MILTLNIGSTGTTRSLFMIDLLKKELIILCFFLLQVQQATQIAGVQELGHVKRYLLLQTSLTITHLVVNIA